MKFVLPLLYFLITICCACESDPIISWESRETSKSLRLVIDRLPNEFNYNFKRRILLYSSKQDLFNNVNPIDEKEYFSSMLLSATYFYNVTVDAVYVRAYSKKIGAIEPAVSFRCEQPIIMSKTNGNTVFELDNGILIEE